MPALKIALMQHYYDSKITWKKRGERLITVPSNNKDKARMNITKTKNRKKNSCIFSSNNKQVKFHPRKLGRENLERETKSLLIAAQNNAIRTNYIKENRKCRLCGNRDEMTHPIVSAAENKHRKSIRLDTTGSTRWSTKKCASNLNLIERSNDKCTIQNVS